MMGGVEVINMEMHRGDRGSTYRKILSLESFSLFTDKAFHLSQKKWMVALSCKAHKTEKQYSEGFW